MTNIMTDAMADGTVIIAKGAEGKMPGKKCYTVKEVQEILRISKPTVYKLLKKNEFRWLIIAGKYLIVCESFDAWMQEKYGVCP